MGCIGSIVRSPFRPLANLVDAAAEKWLAAADGSSAERQRIKDEITSSFKPGDSPELTFHGMRYLLTVIRTAKDYELDVHEIVQSE